jgi:hypothetical protein
MTSSNSVLTFNVGIALPFLLGGYPAAAAESAKVANFPLTRIARDAKGTLGVKRVD